MGIKNGITETPFLFRSLLNKLDRPTFEKWLSIHDDLPKLLMHSPRHGRVRMRLPLQLMPDRIGIGLVQVRVRDWLPLASQAELQWLHGLQADHPPSTGHRSGFLSNVHRYVRQNRSWGEKETR